MSDMYGSMISNNFRVKDAAAFLEWADRYVLGEEVSIHTIEEHDDGTATMRIAGNDHYAQAWPKRSTDTDIDDDTAVEPEDFAAELAAHLCEGEIAYIMAGGDESERVMITSELAVTTGRYAYRCASSDDLRTAREMIQTHGQPIANAGA